MKKVLTIAGSDSSGGAGVQADLKTMGALGVFGMSVITAVTAQNTVGVQDVMDIPPEIVEAQIKSIFDDIDVDAVKIGMLSNSRTISVIRNLLKKYNATNIVLDPVMVSTSGYLLLKKEALEAIRDLIGVVDIVTPNIPEAEVLTGLKIVSRDDMVKAAFKVKELGPKNVLVKGGHRYNDANDILLYKNKIIELKGRKIDSKNTHGTGCTLSSAIASYMARDFRLDKAVSLSKEYVTKAIENSFSIGHGSGPLGHFADLYKKSGVSYN